MRSSSAKQAASWRSKKGSGTPGVGLAAFPQAQTEWPVEQARLARGEAPIEAVEHTPEAGQDRGGGVRPEGQGRVGLTSPRPPIASRGSRERGRSASTGGRRRTLRADVVTTVAKQVASW